MSTTLSLRPATADDLAELHRIRTLAFAPVFDSFRSLVGEEIAPIAFATAEAEQGHHLDEICQSQSGHQVFCVVEADEILGFVGFKVDPAKRTGELGLNAVAPAHCGRGIGTWMYGQMLAKMKALGAEVVEVGTGADESHAPARRAYEKAGFRHRVPGVHLYLKL